ncbi:MAG: PadR family transcriptional regulator [Fimbriimonadaceae bacterium]|nr:PadR family transcriptional regulator [Fimbriimonadaceae bacterium]
MAKPDIETLILGSLRDRPLHGYGILKRIEKDSGGFFKAKEGRLYPVLRTMEEEQLITGEWQPQEGRPPRRIYTLSDSGKAKLKDKTEQWGEFIKAMNKLMGL